MIGFTKATCMIFINIMLSLNYFTSSQLQESALYLKQSSLYMCIVHLCKKTNSSQCKIQYKMLNYGNMYTKLLMLKDTTSELNNVPSANF